MEPWLQRVFDEYPRLCEQAKSLAGHLEAGEVTVRRRKYAWLTMQIGTVESWFTLLEVDERVVVRQMLLVNDENAIAAGKAAAIWVRRLAANRLAPLKLREQAIGKIEGFSSRYYWLVDAVFPEKRCVPAFRSTSKSVPVSG